MVPGKQILLRPAVQEACREGPRERERERSGYCHMPVGLVAQGGGTKPAFVAAVQTEDR